MRNLIITVIALIIIVGIIAFISFNYGKKGYFDLKVFNNQNEEKTDQNNLENLPTPKTTNDKTVSEKTTTNPQPQSQPVKNIQYLAPTGTPTSQSQPEIKTYKATQTTIIIINGKKQTYNQETYFNSNQNLSQFQKATLKY